MEKLEPHYVIKAYEKEAAVEKYIKSNDEVGLWKSEKKVIGEYTDYDDHILELGCASGRVSCNLYKLGYKHLTGIDLSENMIHSARKYAVEQKTDVKFYVDDAMDLKLKSDEYHCVLFMFNGLMLIPGYDNRLKVLKEVKRVLKKDGTFIFTSHDINANSDYKDFWQQQKRLWDLGLNDKRLYEYGDIIDSEIDENDSFIHFPTDSEIREMAYSQGFDVLYSEFRDRICDENQTTKEFS